MKDAASDKIRILVVDDIPETRENLRKMLGFEPDIEVVGTAASGQEGIKLARQFQPQIVLMDINMPGVDGISAVEAIVQEAPNTQVIMMSVQSESDYLRRSMLAGARDFLTKPFSGDELVSTIHRVFDMSLVRGPLVSVNRPNELQTTGTDTPAMPRRGKIITVFGAKGGAGCSVVAVNLALALTDAKTRVCVVDADLQFGDVGVLLNLQPQRNITDLVQRLEELDADLLNTMLIPHPSGLKALLAPPRPEMAELVNADPFKVIMGELVRSFDIVVIDSAPTLNDISLAALDLSERLLLVTSPDIPALKNVRLFFDVAEALEFPKDKILLVVNKFDKRLSNITMKDISEAIKHPVVGELPLDLRECLTSVNRGMPFVLADRKHALSQSIMSLAATVRQELGLTAPEAKPATMPGKRSGLFRWLLARA